LKLVETFGGHRKADEPSTIPGHEIDYLWRYFLGCTSQIAFILPILIVDNYDHSAISKIFNGVFYRCERHTSSNENEWSGRGVSKNPAVP
jgi:hypothetical protein